MEPRPISAPAPSPRSAQTLAAAITRAASKQAYYTIRFLADKSLIDDAYRAYAYFRWVDDRLDQDRLPRADRLGFIRRQQALMDDGYRGKVCADLTPEERLLIDLIQRDTDASSGLHTYVESMMAVMAFDADRRGRLVGQREMDDYTHWLAVAVTEALHYFIGHNCASPHDGTRYLAATGAHIAHMLRDATEDAAAGYYNLPRELVVASGVAPEEVESEAYREWVKERVQTARACFRAGRRYLARVESLRCRVAGYAYIGRFEIVLDCIEREGYRLRAEYPERKGRRRGLGMMGRALWMALSCCQPGSVTGVQPVR